ncbi:MAG: hypothetical protein ATN35_06740 [Epulopiscium sp. Nele67-Bin004]|nr:MAG: hypothetical protein ATN35_06740 [Epulopiscium sp. Nele67-Bin004]
MRNGDEASVKDIAELGCLIIRLILLSGFLFYMVVVVLNKEDTVFSSGSFLASVVGDSTLKIMVAICEIVKELWVMAIIVTGFKAITKYGYKKIWSR